MAEENQTQNTDLDLTLNTNVNPDDLQVPETLDIQEPNLNLSIDTSIGIDDLPPIPDSIPGLPNPAETMVNVDEDDEVEEDTAVYEETVKSTDQILQEFCSFDEATNALFQMCQSATSVGATDVKSFDESVTAISNLAKNIDEFGKACKYGTPCKVCGKNMKHVPINGYCSIKCFLEDLKKYLMAAKKKPNDVDALIEQLQKVLDMMSMVLNIVAEFPQKLIDAAKLPVRYRNYVQIRLNILFLTVRIAINKLMIIKNNIILRILQPITEGIMDNKIVSKYKWLQTTVEFIQKLYAAFDSTYVVILNLLSNPQFSIPPESYVWLMTPRSVTTLPGKLYAEVPISGVINAVIPGGSIMSCLQIDKINSILQGLFPPILAPEYLMDPKLFRVRLAFSDQSDMVRQVGEMLETFLKIGPEWYPKYKDLKITNPFFVYAMLISWGPRGQQMFGSHVLPFA